VRIGRWGRLTIHGGFSCLVLDGDIGKLWPLKNDNKLTRLYVYVVCRRLRSDSAQVGSRRPASAFVSVILGPFADSCDASSDVSRNPQGEQERMKDEG